MRPVDRYVLMPAGTLRYWAAAKEAAGVAEEPYDAATLAAALSHARARHSERFIVVLDRCSYVVDGAPVGGRDHASVVLTDGGVIEVLPPFAGGSGDEQPRGHRRTSGVAGGAATPMSTPRRAVPPGAGGAPRRTGPDRAKPRRPPNESSGRVPTPARRRPRRSGDRRDGTAVPLAVGLTGALAAVLLAVAALVGGPVLVVVTVLVQVFLLVGWLIVLGAPAAGGGAVIGVGAAVVADVMLLIDRSAPLSDLAGILGVCLLIALAQQLARPRRDRLTESFAAILTAVMLGASLAMVVALRGGHGGRQAVAAAMFALAGALLVGRTADAMMPSPQLVARSRRAPLGLLLGLSAGAGVGALYGAGAAPLHAGSAALLGGVVAIAGAAADLAVAVGMAGAAPRPIAARTPGGRPASAHHDKGRIALLVVPALLPVAVAVPVAYLTGRMLVG